ncbi:MAG: hypothetical protein EOP52_04280 [Sphingobacteriales bacterium]|nr:MAG: hypothetical protein EOP52_04280 [Sphingobacteriales bacterium]
MPLKSACIFLFLLLGSRSFWGRAQSPFSAGTSRQEAVVAAFRAGGILPATSPLQSESVGFRVDTLRHSCISCDALFMEHLRSHTTPAQLATLLQQTAGSPDLMASPATALPETETTVFRPLVVDDLVFVLVQQWVPSGIPEVPARPMAFLVVLREVNGRLLILEQSPRCRLRTASDHRSGTGPGCKVSK